jgi:hypothetical protein
MSDLRLRAVAVPALGAAAMAVLMLAGVAPAAAAQPHRLSGSARGLTHLHHVYHRTHARPPQTLPLHARPGDASAVVGRLASGDRFTTHQTDGGWTFIHDHTNRAEGWAHFAHPHHTAPGPRTPGHD